MSEITTQTVYKDDVARVLARYGKPFAKALKKMLDEIERLEERRLPTNILEYVEQLERDNA